MTFPSVIVNFRWVQARVEKAEVNFNKKMFSTNLFYFCLTKHSHSRFWWPLPITEGLQSELESANKEGECVRKRLKFQDDQLEKIKETTELSASEVQNRYGEPARKNEIG